MKRRLSFARTSSFCILLFILCCFNRISAQNLITNGCFESGGVGTGFQSNYGTGPALNTPHTVYVNTGSTNSTVDNNTYVNCADHTTGSTSGNALVVQGANYDASGDKIYEAKPATGISVVNGATYIFTYWIESLTPGNPANITVQFNNGAITATLIAGSAIAPSTTCAWQQVSYQFTTNSNTVQIALNNSTSTQSAFALDDISLVRELSVAVSGANAVCPQGTGTIVAAGAGGSDALSGSCGTGIPSYTYGIDGTFQASPVFSGLAAGTYQVTMADGVGDTTVSAPVTVTIPANPLDAGSDETISCSGGSVGLMVTGGSGTYGWSPATGLDNPNIANPTASYVDTTSIVYTVTSSMPVPDAITNSDFSSGDAGFLSDYTAFHPNNPSRMQGAYAITTASGLFEDNPPSNFTACGDHTTGTGNMMVVDAATAPEKPSGARPFRYNLLLCTLLLTGCNR